MESASGGWPSPPTCCGLEDTDGLGVAGDALIAAIVVPIVAVLLCGCCCAYCACMNEDHKAVMKDLAEQSVARVRKRRKGGGKPVAALATIQSGAALGESGAATIQKSAV